MTILRHLRPPRTFVSGVMLFILGNCVMLGGLLLIQPLVPDDGSALTAFEGVEPAMIAAIGYLVLACEAVIFTILPAELSQRFWRRPAIGLWVGAIAYSPLFHASNGLWGIILSAWIVSVIAVVYSIQRRSSAIAAALQAIGMKWAFWTVSLATIVSEGT